MNTALVVYAFPRCGSTAVCSLIDEHPAAVCIQDPFDISGEAAVARDTFHFMAETGGPWTFGEAKKDYAVRKLYGCREAGIQLAAMKSIFGAIRKEKEWFSARADMKKICLWRKDFLASFVSFVEFLHYGKGAHRGLPGTRAAASLSIVSDWVRTPPREEKIVVTPGQVRSFFEEYTQSNVEMRQSFPDALTIEYEQLLNDADKLAVDIFAFLGLPDEEIRFPTVKVNTSPLQDRVENYDEMVAAFHACNVGLN